MKKRKRGRLFQFGLLGLDTNLLVALLFLMVFGFVMIYSASYYTASMSSTYNNDPVYLLKNQVIYSILGIIAMLVVSNINYHVWSKLALLGYAACLVLVLLLVHFQLLALLLQILLLSLLLQLLRLSQFLLLLFL